MIVELASVGTTPKAIAKSFEPAEIDLDGEDVALTGPAGFEGEAVRVAGQVHIRGRLKADALFDCTRCVEPVAKRLDIPFDAAFVEAAQEPRGTEIEVPAEALDESIVEDGKINIADVVREQILLAVPEQVFCRDDCKGLCPKCGANLNLIDCKCRDDEIDPRWAALRNLN